MICPKCNVNLPDGSAFCSACGEKLEAASEVVISLEPAPAAVPENTNVTANEAVAAAPCEGDVSTPISAPEAAAEGGAPAKKKRKMLFFIIGAAVLGTILTVGIAIGSLLIVNAVRTNEIYEKLQGKEYVYYDSTDYSYIQNSYTIKAMSFQEKGKCGYAYYYSNIDSGDAYTRNYTVKFELDGDVFLEMGIDTYEVKFDNYGNIESLTAENGEEFLEYDEYDE